MKIMPADRSDEFIDLCECTQRVPLTAYNLMSH